MFMEGNIYALDNIRSLIAMGVSYNEDGLTYLEKVGDEAEKYSADKTIYDNEDYTELASMIAIELSSISNMLKELEANEPDMNWDDEEVSDLELQFIDVKLVATMFKEVAYTADKTLYDFVIKYTYNENDYTALYPLVAALNEGQIAMTRVAHYYDVIRYSTTLESSEDIETQLAEAEAEYAEYPFNVYEGVDRTIYRDTFALTSAAYRADAFTESGLINNLFQGGTNTANMVFGGIGAVGVTIMAATFAKHAYHRLPAWLYASKFKSVTVRALNNVASFENFEYSSVKLTPEEMSKLTSEFVDDSLGEIEEVVVNFNASVDHFKTAFTSKGFTLPTNFDSMSAYDKIMTFSKLYDTNHNALYDTKFNEFYAEVFEKMGHEDKEFSKLDRLIFRSEISTGMQRAIYGAYTLGGVLTLISAIKLGIDIYNYYHPEYDDIPTAMVDLIDTKDGDRYIKYDVVYEAETKDGGLVAADLNAFKANRWNALYYTKSYEAGKPLLAGEFVISTTSNVPGEKHAPVHRFGEVVCYNLNKYNFNDDHTIYLSIKQSENNKAAVERVPELIGSVFGAGYYILAGGAGALLGVGATVGTKAIIKRRKTKKNIEAEATE
jgi:hypothetical protein